MHQPHSHDTHDHVHVRVAAPSHARAFAIAIGLNAAFVVVEFGFGFAANSTALMADAGHNLSDVLALLLAWGASMLARSAPTARYTYGLRSTSILAALGNAMLLLVACGAIALEAVRRFSDPPVVAETTVMMVAAAGVVVNGISAWLFMRGGRTDLNIRGAFLHMAADAAISVGVVIGAALILFTGWYWLDPAISLGIVAVIVVGTWGLLRESVRLALSAVPAHVDAVAVDHYLRAIPGVLDIHDLHIWGMSTTESALTAHLVMPTGYPEDDFLDDIVRTLRERFLIQHCTLQIERGTSLHRCALHEG